MAKIQDKFDDIQKFSEISLKKIWMNKKDEIWNQYLKLSAKDGFDRQIDGKRLSNS
ncbi:MAG: hypothetical protein WD154_01450 [Nitrosopumilaceae archaeon]